MPNSRRFIVEPMKGDENREFVNPILNPVNEQKGTVPPIVQEMDTLVQSYKEKYENKGTDPQVQRAVDLSIEERAKQPPDETLGMGGATILSHLIRAGEVVASWWSFQRDRDLRDFWMTEDHVGGAIYAMASKISNLDFKILPSDPSVRSQVQMADFFRQTLLETPEYGRGWGHWVFRFVQDLVSADNGAFAQIIGRGAPDGPIVGAPVSVSNLDSSRCLRTRNPIWPIIYQDIDGKRYRLHYTRVLLSSQMPSTRVEMNNVGFCAVSRCINVAQNLMDISRYKQEKLGSRPARMMLIGRRGISAGEILHAFATTEEMDTSRGLSRYRRMVAIAPEKGRGEIDLELIDLASVPDGFNEQESTTLGMFTIALAFGIDAREIWPATVVGASKADAMLQHLKARGKGPGQIMQEIERQINQKFLPDQLTFKFDFQDDEQDAMQAEIRDVRSQRHDRDLESGAVSVRVTREIMLSDGDLTPTQFEQMELSDGRLPSGDSVLTLFFSSDPDIKSLLSSIDLDTALVFGNNDIESLHERLNIETQPQDGTGLRPTVLKSIDAAILKAHQAIAQESWSTKKQKARQALAALEYLREKWEPETINANPPATGGLGGRPRENTQADTERVRNEDDYRGESEHIAVRNVIGKK